MSFLRKLKRNMDIQKWANEKGEFYITELLAKYYGWSCECCGSEKDLDAYHLSEFETDQAGHIIVDSRNENLICLCPACYRKYHENAVEALRHMTNPQVFKASEDDPRVKKYCR